MNKEIMLRVHIDNTKDTKFVFDKVDEISDLVGIDKIEMEMKNREGLFSMIKSFLGWIVR